MSHAWTFCPHCRTGFVPRPGQATGPCPACGKPLVTEEPPAACAHAAGGFRSLHQVRAEAQVVPEAANCVQCGMCSYNCPMEIDVRAHAWRGVPIRDSHCLTCSECVNRCPRGVLRFERIPLFVVK